MKGRHARLCGNVSIVVFLVLHFGLLFFACSHWNNWWSLFVWPPCIVAFFAPAICFNYDSTDSVLHDVQWEAETFQNCRDFGWALAGVLALCAYLPPALAWYNSRFSPGGALMVDAAVMLLHWVYLLWLRIYVLK